MKSFTEAATSTKQHSFLSVLFQGVFFVLLLAVLGVGGMFVAKVYTEDSNISVKVSNNKALRAGDKISVQFSSSMLKDSVEKSITTQPTFSYISWWEGNRELFIKPTQALDPEKTYTVAITNAKTLWLFPQGRISFNVVGVQPPKLLDVYPANNQAEVDTMDTVKIKFDRAIGDDYIAEVKIDPLTGFDYLLDETKKELSIVPKEKLSESTQYKMEVSLRHKELSEYKKQVYTGSFVTVRPKEVTYTTDEAGQPIKTEPKKEEILPQIKEGRYVDIDLSSQTLTIFENGVEKGAYKISSGKNGMNTPEGTFHVLLKAKRPFSKKYGLYMPWFIGFTNLGHGIHELPEWPGGYKEGMSHLGTPVSHGCVRLGVGPAKTVYDFVEKGTPIVIHK